MGKLRKQMDGDLVVRGMAMRTREAYLGAVTGLAKYYRRRPDRIAEAERLKFFHRVTLKQSEAQLGIPTARQPQKLPQILAREEVARLIDLTAHPKHRAILMTTYGTDRKSVR